MASEMEMICRCARRVAASDIRVLILGETGVGKKSMARDIHDLSPRYASPFVAFDCAGALPGDLDRKPFEMKDGSTVMLYRIGDLTLDLQARLLAILDRASRIRFIATADERLIDDVEEGRFRSDLLHRIGQVAIRIPPLRERKDEIADLAQTLLGETCARRDLPPKRLTPEALESLRSHRWPGNIRELANVVERAALFADGDEIGSGDLLLEIAPEKKPNGKARLHDELATLERDRIVEALERAGGNRSRAARILGISRRTITTKVKELGLQAIGREV